ncbi:MAG: hypothetical protein LBJ60_01075 [Tannerellaceae bacterium]|jgi:hypothetical protein|nr:hypothetical protein [Tannerellaceae bacterium]
MNEEELKARIKEEEEMLQFYIRYEKEITQMTSQSEWKIEIDECLDLLADLYKLLKKQR